MIEVKNLTRNFKGGSGLFDVSFEIPQGSIVAFVGDNGAGKTTTIKAIFNELVLEKGQVLIDGKNLHTGNRLKSVAFFPDHNNIPLNMKLNEYIEYCGLAGGLLKHEIKEKLSDIVQMLQLEPYMKKKIKELSAGWKKKAIMASVLIRSPEYIILDEPTANLDVQAKRELIDILKKLNGLGVTILITSHIIEELQEIANRLTLIVKGEIVFSDNFDRNDTKIMDIYNKYKVVVKKRKSLAGLYGMA